MLSDESPRMTVSHNTERAVPKGAATATHPGLRHLLIAFGCLNVALGAVGLFLPVMPTTVFLLIALWAFSKSSPRFRNRLYRHPRLGPFVRDWRRHGVIRPRAKALAVAMMSLSVAFLAVTADNWLVPASTGAGLAVIAGWIVTRPGRPATGTDYRRPVTEPYFSEFQEKKWGERRDSNPRPLGPQPSALTD